MPRSSERASYKNVAGPLPGASRAENFKLRRANLHCGGQTEKCISTGERRHRYRSRQGKGYSWTAHALQESTRRVWTAADEKDLGGRTLGAGCWWECSLVWEIAESVENTLLKDGNIRGGTGVKTLQMERQASSSKSPPREGTGEKNRSSVLRSRGLGKEISQRLRGFLKAK